jgi:hypothetical protein
MAEECCPGDHKLHDCLVERLPAETADVLFDPLERWPRCQAKLQTASDVDDPLVDVTYSRIFGVVCDGAAPTTGMQHTARSISSFFSGISR